jgi:hypothetical protein
VRLQQASRCTKMDEGSCKPFLVDEFQVSEPALLELSPCAEAVENCREQRGLEGGTRRRINLS